MNCLAWKIPEGCYAYALAQSQKTSIPSWVWVVAAVAAGVLILGDKKTTK
jgi:hypothetical protein